MTNTLTEEQIAPCPFCNSAMIYKPEKDFLGHPDGDSDCPLDGSTWRASSYVEAWNRRHLPSPPVSGEAVRLEWRKLDPSQLTLNGVIIGEVEECYSESRDKKYFTAFIGSGENDLIPSEYDTFDGACTALMSTARAWLSPLTNEPVGVIVDRDALQFAVDFISRNQTQKEDAIFLTRLSAAIGELG